VQTGRTLRNPIPLALGETFQPISVVYFWKSILLDVSNAVSDESNAETTPILSVGIRMAKRTTMARRSKAKAPATTTRSKRTKVCIKDDAVPKNKRQRTVAPVEVSAPVISKGVGDTSAGQTRRRRVARQLDPSFVESSTIDHSDGSDQDSGSDQDDSDEASDSGEEYPVKKILDERDGKVLVEWEGTNNGEPWPPEWVDVSDGFKGLLEEFRRSKQIKPGSKQNKPRADSSSTTVVCAICKESDAVGRECLHCKLPVHHFCVVDLGIQLKLSEAEFGEICYCSLQCYQAQRSKAMFSRSQSR